MNAERLPDQLKVKGAKMANNSESTKSTEANSVNSISLGAVDTPMLRRALVQPGENNPAV